MNNQDSTLKNHPLRPVWELMNKDIDEYTKLFYVLKSHRSARDPVVLGLRDAIVSLLKVVDLMQQSDPSVAWGTELKQ